ncbi:OTU-like cysteine protease [Pleurostoma richardsiae]|uniref:OTU-like cysteine protease n=1 Tax=Pleurostoma richardsiae TaxID=41990 RepID=A0AA38RS34_9PEZI|nr:OTU-like cysteine protease [Pleurostoma richardsiae]
MEETLEQMQARHRREQKDLQGRVTNKKKNATKKTRKGVNDECAELERQLKERQAEEARKLLGGEEDNVPPAEGEQEKDGDLNKEGAAAGTKQNGTAPVTSPTQNGEEAISKQLQDTTLSDPTGPPPTKQQQQPAKKRNRQKERLARRAAEQEAAAEAASAEAANMVDYRAAESAYMKREFAAHALVEREIRPDGHCLFSAVADQLEQSAVPLGGPPPGDEPDFRRVRRAAAAYMQAHPDDFAGFLEEPLEEYLAKIRDTAEWGGQLELLALANTYNVEIRVVQDGRTEVIAPTAEGKKGEGEEPKKIWLAYYRHGYGLGEHYNSLRKKA